MSLFEEEPHSFVILEKLKADFCSNCCVRANDTKKLKRCSKCKFVHFCSVSCQEEAWPIHRQECDALNLVAPNVPSDLARLMARVIWKERRIIGSSKQISANADSSTSGDCGRTIVDLLSHKAKIEGDSLRTEHFAVLCRVLRDYMTSDLPSISELLELFGKIVINGLSVLSDDLNVIGTGLYVRLSQLDHSCDPDAVVVFNGRTAMLRPLKPNVSHFSTTLKISYIDLMSTRQERQSQLRDQYYFDCACTRCEDENELDRLMTSVKCKALNCDGIAEFSDTTSSEVRCSKCGHISAENAQTAIQLMQKSRWQFDHFETLVKSDETTTLLKHCLTLLKEQEFVLSSLNIHRVRALDFAMDACIELQKFREAAAFCAQNMDAYRKFYSQFHPNLALQLLKLGKLQLYIERLTDAQLYLEQAQKLLLISHGREHSVYGQCAQLLEECREEQRIHINRQNLGDLSHIRPIANH